MNGLTGCIRGNWYQKRLKTQVWLAIKHICLANKMDINGFVDHCASILVHSIMASGSATNTGMAPHCCSFEAKQPWNSVDNCTQIIWKLQVPPSLPHLKLRRFLFLVFWKYRRNTTKQWTWTHKSLFQPEQCSKPTGNLVISYAWLIIRYKKFT